MNSQPANSAADGTSGESAEFFLGLRRMDVAAGGVRFAGAIGGSGPSLLLLHGYPQAHIAWRKVAPMLAERFTLVIPDLPGYGASKTQTTSPRWTKRRSASALVSLMRKLGFEQFALAGHDRGARIGYRLVLDHPGVVTRFATLAVIPTLHAMERVDYRYAHKSYHWFLLSQPADLPERLLSAAPDAVIDAAFAAMKADGHDVIEPRAREAYRRAFRNPEVRHAICEDYRSAVEEDLIHDRADQEVGRKLDCPVLVITPEAASEPPSPAEIWRLWADDVTASTTNGDHLMLEDRSHQVGPALLKFFGGASAELASRL